MYFFSDIDPNYRIKGSRDPLGFQTLWSAAGHKVVKHLSTVSANLQDFMILAYGYYFYGDRPENKFLNFFLQFEQVCAYARRLHISDAGFNGVDFVNRKLNEGGNTFYVSLNQTDTLLSNQRTYGIFGKYTRPMRDMKIRDDHDFKGVMERSLSKTDKNAIIELVNKLFNTERKAFTKEQLEPMAHLLKAVSHEEKELYRKYILQIPNENHPQNQLYQLVNKNNSLTDSQFNLHETIDAIQSEPDIRPELKSALENVKNTDKVLHPLNRCFTHLLSQGSWTNVQLQSDEFIQSMPAAVSYTFGDEQLGKLNGMLAADKPDLVKQLVERNEHISEQRGSKGWIVKEKNMYKVIYGENGQRQQARFGRGYEFSYFINTWLYLYKQIEMS